MSKLIIIVSLLQETAIQVAYSSKLIGLKDQLIVINAEDKVSIGVLDILLVDN